MNMPCDGGNCEKHPDGVLVVALDDVGERVVRLVGSNNDLPAAITPILEIRVGAGVLAAGNAVIRQIWGEAGERLPQTICLSGGEAWLASAVSAVVQLTTRPGIVCIDFADFRAVFADVGPVRGVSAVGLDATVAGQLALVEGAQLLANARAVLVHVEGQRSTSLRDATTLAEQAERMGNGADTLFNLYISDAVQARVTLLVV